MSNSGNLAYLRGRWRAAFVAPEMPPDSGKFIEIRRREPDGTWPFIAEFHNSNTPMGGQR